MAKATADLTNQHPILIRKLAYSKALEMAKEERQSVGEFVSCLILRREKYKKRTGR